MKLLIYDRKDIIKLQKQRSNFDGLRMGMTGTWAAMFVDWIVKSIIYEWHYKKENWTRFQAI
ncbi:MAG: hypothetical protein LIR50_07730 [Bacillota bacterium]|nr:hypothetical protein [Bacillota bacterium]